MKNIRPFIFCIALGLPGIFSGHALAADSAIYYFEDNSDPASPMNSGAGPFTLHYLGDTQQTTTQAKFGKGSMLIGTTKGDAPIIAHGNGFASLPSEFNDAIKKMTITAWVRPANPPAGERNSFSPGFVIFGRFVGAGMGPGSFIFAYAYDMVELSLFSEGTQKKEVFQSPRIKQHFESEEWTHLAVTFDEGKIVFYINGAPVGDADGSTVNSTVIPETQGKSLLVGFSNTKAGDCIDDFGFLTERALSEAEIEKVYTSGLQEFIKNSAAKK